MLADLSVALGAQVDSNRLSTNTLKLAQIRSYPGEEEDIAAAYAQLLEEAGARVELERTIPGSPSVIARVGHPDAVCLQLGGHLDTVPLDHEPPIIQAGRIYGRGTCDMKAGLAAALEVVRLLAPHLDDLRAQILVTAYGLHEGSGAAPMHTPLRSLLAAGYRGDAAIVCEGPRQSLPVAGKGSLIYSLAFVRAGTGADHELRAGDAPNPILAAHRWINLVSQRTNQSELRHPTLGGDTFFVGSIHGGELYNTVPKRVEIQGVRRYPPPRDVDDVRAELDAMSDQVANEFDVIIDRDYQPSGQPFEFSPRQPIVLAMAEAHRKVLGLELPLGSQWFASDLNHFVADAAIPTAAYGVDPSRGHSTPEYVSISQLTETTRIYVLTAVSFFQNA